MKFIIFTTFVMIAVIMAASQAEKQTCSPMGKTCESNSDCCRALRCKLDSGECVPIGGTALPGLDTRPIGPGPYPSNLLRD
ncbi:uncharacterized protein LOC114255740 [Monomorium pharaonis]|uniref:uncharacterized protein LOC114255740 n=1 Tax=Monomorium pharaonis TaxID=307658 RepID=UPI00102E1F0F|nr:uncharacterized protein LOC114255740 [Monomorium pharaonis]